MEKCLILPVQLRLLDQKIWHECKLTMIFTMDNTAYSQTTLHTSMFSMDQP